MDIKEKGFGCASGLETSGSGNDTVVWSCEQGMNTWVPLQILALSNFPRNSVLYGDS